MNATPGIVLLLSRALYGLKRSPALWQKHLCTTLKDLGLNEVSDAPCLFTNDFLIIFFFVDDVIMAYKQEHEGYAVSFQEQLFKRYEMRVMGELQWFLELRIVRDRQQRHLWLSQESHVSGLLVKYNVKDHSFARTPLPADEDITSNDGHATAQDIHIYQSIMGSINFAAVSTRPGVAFAMRKLSEFLQNPSRRHIYLSEYKAN